MTNKILLGRFLVNGPGESDDYIVLKSHHNKWLAAENDAYTITNTRTTIGPWEKFQIIFTSGKVALKTWKHKYFSAQPNGKLEANRANLGPWEKFDMYIDGCYGKVAFKGHFGKWIVAEQNGQVKCDRTNLAQWEQFTA